MLEARRDRLGPEQTWPRSLVFTNAFGGPVDPGNWRRREWLPALQASGLGTWSDTKPPRFVPAYRVHDLRHFAVTRLDELGMGGKLRTEIAGHADEEITNAVYTHVSRARIAEAATQFDPMAATRG
jgi:integrase